MGKRSRGSIGRNLTKSGRLGTVTAGEEVKLAVGFHSGMTLIPSKAYSIVRLRESKIVFLQVLHDYRQDWAAGMASLEGVKGRCSTRSQDTDMQEARLIKHFTVSQRDVGNPFANSPEKSG